MFILLYYANILDCYSSSTLTGHSDFYQINIFNMISLLLIMCDFSVMFTAIEILQVKVCEYCQHNLL